MRKIVGSTYKEKGKSAAIEKALSLISLIELSQNLQRIPPSQTPLIYCARGGLRSASLAWLWGELFGHEILVLEGGYKTFRAYGRKLWEKPLSLHILGGKTATGKTRLLEALETAGEAVLHLERLANHKGSVFGGLSSTQPSQEHFENLLFFALDEVKNKKRIFVEDESRSIGALKIPDPLFNQMQKAPILILEASLEERIAANIAEYSLYPKASLKGAIRQIEKRLGSQATHQALQSLEENNFHECSKILLAYYDKKYFYSLSIRPEIKKSFYTLSGKTSEETFSFLRTL